MKVLYIIVFLFFIGYSPSSFGQSGFLDNIKGAAENIRDSNINFELPDFSSIASESTASAIKFASDSMVMAVSEISAMKPILENYGFHVANVQFQMLPPAGRFCIVSATPGVDINFDELINENTFARTILYVAVAAKKVQLMLDYPIIVMNVDIGAKSNIQLYYYSNEDIEEDFVISSGLYDEVCDSSFL